MFDFLTVSGDSLRSQATPLRISYVCHYECEYIEDLNSQLFTYLIYCSIIRDFRDKIITFLNYFLILELNLSSRL